MKRINKAMLDELIRLTRKYFKTGDTDILPAKNEMAVKMAEYTFGKEIYWNCFTSLIDAIYGGIFSLVSNATNKTAYDVFTTLGFEIVDEREAD